MTSTSTNGGALPPQKFLPYAAILTLAANTMNGPGITTLPDVAVDAGLFLYVILITGSVAMASYVCRRMVFAMWSSLKSYGKAADTELGTYHDVVEPNLTKGGSEEDSLLLHNGNPNLNGGDNSVAYPQPKLETTSIVGQSVEAYGKKAGVYAALTMVASALCLALAQMMLCAAILDGMLVSTTGQSCALGLPTSSNSSWIHCTSHSSMKPYAGSGAPTSLISVGTVIAAVFSVGMGTVDLDEMMGVQYSLFACLIISCVRFAYVLRKMSLGLSDEGEMMDMTAAATEEGSVGGEEEEVLSWFVGPNPFSTIGPIMFNFAFVVTAPPLVSLAKKESIAYKALGMACVAMGVLYTMVGCVGAPVANAVRNGLIEGGDDTNLLSLILLSGNVEGGADGRPSMIDLFCIGTFGLSTVASVPVYCLLAKDTLVNDAGVARMPAFLLSNVLPWLLVALTYNAAFFEAFVNWSGLLILGYSNFSLPLLLDVKLKKVRSLLGEEGSITSVVFSFLTASISAVIAISITNSLAIAGLLFGAVMIASMWPSQRN
uniref:Amino acid transporter transmembrane domain-containing protein n=1 Tax=Skeletonema marinoi TaxID=267567 RepID=A0A7S2Q4V9_9STRA|mmetsp:Transcript_9513/g.16215  ORF Transcript_9513/g.16215 Transcript_9513/m.16215 type:complete len:545 (+) Transcript_9513:217-1851(+)